MFNVEQPSVKKPTSEFTFKMFMRKWNILFAICVGKVLQTNPDCKTMLIQDTGAKYLVFISSSSLKMREICTNWDKLVFRSLYIFSTQSHLHMYLCLLSQNKVFRKTNSIIHTVQCSNLKVPASRERTCMY